MTLQVHDELVFEVPESEVEAMKPLVREHMEKAYALEVPLLVEIGVGPTGETWSKSRERNFHRARRLRKTIPTVSVPVFRYTRCNDFASAVLSLIPAA